METAIGIIIDISAAGGSSENVSRNNVSAVFWTPISIEMAMRSSFDCLNIAAAMKPNMLPRSGRPKPAPTIWEVGSVKISENNLFR